MRLWSPRGLIGGAEREDFEALAADVGERWQAISTIVAIICAPDEANDAMSARVADCRSDVATALRANEPCGVTTAPRLPGKREAAPSGSYATDLFAKGRL